MIRLTNEQWERIREHFSEESYPAERAGRGPIPARRVLEAALWILNTGAQWRMLPQSYPNYRTVHRRFQLWCQSEVLRHALTDLANQEDEQVTELVNTALGRRPDGRTHWSVRSLATRTGLSATWVHRHISLFGLQPHRSKSFKLSDDPFFVEKVRDIVGLYLSPPENALVLCVDEKSQCQAPERTQPMLPMGLGYVEGITHDYKRHGTATLFAALDVTGGEVLAQYKQRHHHQEFLGFLRHIERSVPADLDLHLICDNYATHKHPKVRAWLARRPRYRVHFMPTHVSWLNQVEHWFGLITQQAIRRSSFKSVPDLVGRIKGYPEHYDLTVRPFIWTATADSILAKIQRLCKVIGGTRH